MRELLRFTQGERVSPAGEEVLRSAQNDRIGCLNYRAFVLLIGTAQKKCGCNPGT